MTDFSSITEQDEKTLTPAEAIAEFRSYAKSYAEDFITYGVYARAEQAALRNGLSPAAIARIIKTAKLNRSPRNPVDISGWLRR